jgi:uncharacterized protein
MVIEGPKGCGKTATARQLAASEVLLDVDESARRAVEMDPELILDGPARRLIDEWQIEPSIWNDIRRAVDGRTEPGQFILTGSAVPADDITRHTGAGRIARLRMRPMSLYETGHADGTVSLRDLLDGAPARGADASPATCPRMPRRPPWPPMPAVQTGRWTTTPCVTAWARSNA